MLLLGRTLAFLRARTRTWLRRFAAASAMEKVIWTFIPAVGFCAIGSLAISAFPRSPATPAPSAEAVAQAAVLANPPPGTAQVEPTTISRPAITATLNRDADLFTAPAENYPTAAQLKAGDTIMVLYRSGEWFNVAKGEDVTGWVPRKWIDLARGLAETVQPFPDALPVLSGDVAHQPVAGGTLFRGRVRNLGAKVALKVRVDIETFDADNNRVDLVQSYVEPIDLPPGEEGSFTVTTSQDAHRYFPSVHWFER